MTSKEQGNRQQPLVVIQNIEMAAILLYKTIKRRPCWLTKPIPEWEYFLLVESGIVGFGIRNIAQVIRNPTIDWNLESS